VALSALFFKQLFEEKLNGSLFALALKIDQEMRTAGFCDTPERFGDSEKVSVGRRQGPKPEGGLTRN
jgi:hypothetical protein